MRMLIRPADACHGQAARGRVASTGMSDQVVTAEEVAALVGHRATADFAASQILFYRGHLPAGLWVLVRGEVVLREDGAVTAYVVGPALLGLKDLMATAPYPFTAQTMTACELAFIGKEELQPYLHRPPLAAMAASLTTSL